MRYPKAAFPLLFVFFIGAMLRLFHLGTQGLFLDEAWSWAVAGLPLTELLMLPAKDPHPILYYLILKAILNVLPATEIALRAFSVICSLLVMALVSIFVSRRWNLSAAFYACWFIAFSTFDLYYAQETRMYTFFGLLWVSAYMLLIKATTAPSYLFLWSISLIALVWTHFYGILVALVHAIFCLGWWAWQKRNAHVTFSGRWLFLNLLLVLTGSLPMLLILWNHRSGGAGGAWVPQLPDLVALFALWSVGLTAARTYFLDSSNLLIPPLASLSVYSFALLGFLLSGIYAIRGFIQNWQAKGERQLAAVLAILLIIAPVALVYSYAALFERRMWAFKPFLGAAYLFYIWVGIGLSSLSSKLWRRTVASAMIIVALFSLLPYYTKWQKSDAAKAFGTLPANEQHIVVLLNPAYLEPLASFYLHDSIELWGASSTKEGNWSIFHLTDKDKSAKYREAIECSELEHIQKIWIYGHFERIQQQVKEMPDCIKKKIFWIYHENQWQLLPPPI